MTKNKNKLNFPTVLTLARIILTIPLFILIFCDCLPAKIIAIICFVVASITDFIDGKLARKNKQVTDLGAFLDPLADKMLINLTLLALCYQNLVPIWMFAIIIVRDFAVDGIRMMAAKKGITVAASKTGKLKTTVQMIALSLVLANKIFMNDILLNVNIVLLSLMLLLTVVSGLEYIIKGWKLVIK
ncbi:CDP-diacylglycerol--glycerol-3-phosphate 3-phosphatidyltransferase [Candidatus Saccharibacteria bacterium]|nr:CDP-diacylglycerol--glycerol-3-phosphate 3-phosphatidyltransferase [Candidatus Saccharibacteria bacterium]